MEFKKFFSIIKEAFSKPKYWFIGILSALIFYIISTIAINYRNIQAVYSSERFFGTLGVFPNFLIDLKDFMTTEAFILLVIIGILIGILMSLIAYRAKALKDASGKSGFLTSLGIFFGVLAPGCAACGLGILPVLGIGASFLAFLPFRGLEFSIISVLILMIIIFKVTKDINKGISCEIDTKVKGGQK